MASRTQPTGTVCCTSLGNLEHLFKAVADQTRLRILALLADGEVCVCDIQAALGISQPKTSRHLAYLRRMGLVVDRKEGLWVYYRLADPEDPVVRTLLSAVLHGLSHAGGMGAAAGVPKFACCVSPRNGR
jgi:ArsR family transcriptional regulator, arsenate/arsenite/antimonite-responsive transcriptional repressor